MAKKKSNINKYINNLGLNEVYSKISRGSSFIPGVIDEAKLSGRVIKKDQSYKAKPFNKSLNNIRPILEAGFSSRGNFRTNYTPPPPFDTDASAFFTAVEDAGGTLTDNVKAEFDAFVVREKDAGRWSKIKRLYPYLGGVINSAIIDAVTTNAATNTNFVDGDVDSLIGLQGDGSTKSLLESENTDVIFSSINNGLGVIFDGTQTNPSVFQGVVGFYESTTTKFEALQFDTSNKVRFYSPALADAISTTTTSFESIIGWRESSTSQKLAIDTTVTTNTVAASISTLSSVKIGYFGRSFNGTVFNQNSLKYLLAFLQEGMDESEILAFRSSYKTFINNIQAYAASQAYFAAVETAGGTLSDNVKSQFSAFVSREVEANRWSKIKRLYPYLGGVINSAIIDVVTTNAATNNNFVDADADATIGLQGDGSTKSLRLTETTNLILPDSTDFQIGVFRIGAVEQPSSLSRLMGHFYSSNPLGCLYLQKNQLQPQVFATDSVSAYGGVLSSNSSHIGASFSSSDLNLLLDGVVVNTNSTARSTPFSAHLMDLFSININGSSTSFSSIKSGGMFIASGLSLTETQAFESSYRTFINNITA